MDKSSVSFTPDLYLKRRSVGSISFDLSLISHQNLLNALSKAIRKCPDSIYAIDYKYFFRSYLSISLFSKVKYLK